MIRANHLVEWVRLISAERRAKEWAGGPGAAFWRPLLSLLCYPHRNDTLVFTMLYKPENQLTVTEISSLTPTSIAEIYKESYFLFRVPFFLLNFRKRAYFRVLRPDAFPFSQRRLTANRGMHERFPIFTLL